MTDASYDFTDILESMGELCVIVESIGMWDQLSEKTKLFVQQNNYLQKKIANGEGPRLEPRVTMEEFRDFVMKMHNVPPSQYDFYNVIIKISYLLLMVEKNPLLVQELRGVNQISGVLDNYMKG